MGNVRVHLSAVTRDSLRQLAQIASRIGTVSLTQALRILRTAIEAALRKCKTSKQNEEDFSLKKDLFLPMISMIS